MKITKKYISFTKIEHNLLIKMVNISTVNFLQMVYEIKPFDFLLTQIFR